MVFYAKIGYDTKVKYEKDCVIGLKNYQDALNILK